MGKGSLLKKLKTDLESHDQLRHQKKRKLGAVPSSAKQHENRALQSIRQTFNPFDVKFNKNKSEIGRTAANARRAGAPSATKSTAEKERQQVYKAQKQVQNKVGMLVDRRIVKDTTLSAEEKLVQAYAREKANRSRKSFNLDDEFHDDYEEDGDAEEPVLERVNDLKSNADGYAFDSNYYGPSRLTEAANQLEEREEQPQRKKTKAEVMQEVIAKSKMYKAERQIQKSADEDMVDALNADFDDLMADLNAVETNSKAKSRVVDEYDKNVTQLAFERRADPQNRTKTAEEIEKEEKEAKEREEQARRARMEGDDLDVPEDARDDADLFGLHVSSDEETTTPQNEAAPTTGYAEVDVPLSLTELKRAAASTADVKSYLTKCIQRATPGRGSGDAEKLRQLCCAILDYGIIDKSNFALSLSLLHPVAPQNGVGNALGNRARDLLDRTKTKPVWGSKEVLLFAFIGSLFSTSDQWHVVVTTAMVIACARLSSSVNTDLASVSVNLAVCDVLLAYERFAKRYIPEIPMYLLRTLSMLTPGVQTEAGHYIRLAPQVETEFDIPDTVNLQIGAELTAGETVLAVAKLVNRSASLWRSLDAFPELWDPVLHALEPYNANHVVSECLKTVNRLVSFSRTDRKFLELQSFKPIGIVSRAPLFDDNYNPEAKGYGQSPLQREQQKLKAQLKKEKKGALREIRRDTEFEARQQLSEKRQEMSEYHEKLRKLEGQINGEEGAERNAYERERSKKRKRHY